MTTHHDTWTRVFGAISTETTAKFHSHVHCNPSTTPNAPCITNSAIIMRIIIATALTSTTMAAIRRQMVAQTRNQIENGRGGVGNVLNGALKGPTQQCT